MSFIIEDDDGGGSFGGRDPYDFDLEGPVDGGFSGSKASAFGGKQATTSSSGFGKPAARPTAATSKAQALMNKYNLKGAGGASRSGNSSRSVSSYDDDEDSDSDGGSRRQTVEQQQKAQRRGSSLYARKRAASAPHAAILSGAATSLDSSALNASGASSNAGGRGSSVGSAGIAAGGARSASVAPSTRFRQQQQLGVESPSDISSDFGTPQKPGAAAGAGGGMGGNGAVSSRSESLGRVLGLDSLRDILGEDFQRKQAETQAQAQTETETRQAASQAQQAYQPQPSQSSRAPPVFTPDSASDKAAGSLARLQAMVKQDISAFELPSPPPASSSSLPFSSAANAAATAGAPALFSQAQARAQAAPLAAAVVEEEEEESIVDEEEEVQQQKSNPAGAAAASSEQRGPPDSSSAGGGADSSDYSVDFETSGVGSGLPSPQRGAGRAAATAAAAAGFTTTSQPGAASMATAASIPAPLPAAAAAAAGGGTAAAEKQATAAPLMAQALNQPIAAPAAVSAAAVTATATASAAVGASTAAVGAASSPQSQGHGASAAQTVQPSASSVPHQHSQHVQPLPQEQAHFHYSQQHGLGGLPYGPPVMPGAGVGGAGGGGGNYHYPHPHPYYHFPASYQQQTGEQAYEQQFRHPMLPHGGAPYASHLAHFAPQAAIPPALPPHHAFPPYYHHLQHQQQQQQFLHPGAGGQAPLHLALGLGGPALPAMMGMQSTSSLLTALSSRLEDLRRQQQALQLSSKGASGMELPFSVPLLSSSAPSAAAAADATMPQLPGAEGEFSVAAVLDRYKRKMEDADRHFATQLSQLRVLVERSKQKLAEAAAAGPQNAPGGEEAPVMADANSLAAAKLDAEAYRRKLEQKSWTMPAAMQHVKNMQGF